MTAELRDNDASSPVLPVSIREVNAEFMAMQHYAALFPGSILRLGGPITVLEIPVAGPDSEHIAIGGAVLLELAQQHEVAAG